MKSHKETKTSKIQQPTKFCIHHKISHSNVDSKQNALILNASSTSHTIQPKRLPSPSKKLERPSSFTYATIESTNKNIQKEKICQRANLLRSRSALTNHVKRERDRVRQEELSPRRKPMEEFEKKKKILRMRKILDDFERHRKIDVEKKERESPERSRRFNTCKQIRSKSEPRADQKTILFDIMEREAEPVVSSSMTTSVSSAKAIVRDTGKFDMVRKFFEEPSLKRCYSMSSIKQPPVNKYSIIFKNSAKFKDLHNFFRNLEKLNELKRSTSCVDVRPIRKESDLIDYDVWRSTHDNVKTKRKFESLYAQVKEMEKAKHFLYECSNVSKNKWKKDEDFGLRNRIRTINDLKKIFTSGNEDPVQMNNRKALENDELFKKHGVSTCLIRMLTSTQMNKLRKQLTEIYQENILENKNNNKQVELKNNKNKLLVKPIFLNRDVNIKNKIQYYENKLYCVPPGNTIYRAKSDLEPNDEEESKIQVSERKKIDEIPLYRTLPSRQSSKSISCLITENREKETDNPLKRSYHMTRGGGVGGYNKSISTEDLTTYKNNMNDVRKNKSVLKSNKAEIYERLNAFILKKLENMNGKYLIKNTFHSSAIALISPSISPITDDIV